MIIRNTRRGAPVSFQIPTSDGQNHEVKLEPRGMVALPEGLEEEAILEHSGNQELFKTGWLERFTPAEFAKVKNARKAPGRDIRLALPVEDPDGQRSPHRRSQRWIDIAAGETEHVHKAFLETVTARSLIDGGELEVVEAA